MYIYAIFRHRYLDQEQEGDKMSETNKIITKVLKIL